MSRIRPSLFALSALLFVLIEATQACQLCVQFPNKSAADHLLAARTAILAREASFAYKPIEVLKGTAPESKIDLLVDSSTRRMLTANPTHSILLAESPDGKWQRIGVVNTEFDPVVRKVLSSGAQWKTDPRSRISYFTSLLSHHNPQIRTLAYLEVGRAPYDEIRQMGKLIPRVQIRGFLGNLQYVEWHPLYILLLAQEAEDQDRATIARSFRSATRFGITTRLAAWSTAYIEIAGEQAIDEIEQNILKNLTRTPEVLQEVTKALSIHGTYGSEKLRNRIVASYQTLVATHPEMICIVAKDLTTWKRPELHDEISKHLATSHEKDDESPHPSSHPHK
jgi:hypothetical protein